MKNVFKFSTVLFAIIALAACSKKSGSSAAAAPGVGITGGACVMGAGGVCTNGTPYFGPGGRWSGQVIVANPALLQQFFMEQGRPSYLYSTYGLSISLYQSGSGAFALSVPMGYSWQKIFEKRAGRAYTVGNGFSIVFQNYYLNGGFTPYNGSIMPPTIDTSVQVSATFVDPSQMSIAVTVSYRGQQMMTGQLMRQLRGSMGYRAAPAVLPAR
jgi:hypothetical protein